MLVVGEAPADLGRPNDLVAATCCARDVTTLPPGDKTPDKLAERTPAPSENAASSAEEEYSTPSLTVLSGTPGTFPGQPAPRSAAVGPKAGAAVTGWPYSGADALPVLAPAAPDLALSSQVPPPRAVGPPPSAERRRPTRSGCDRRSTRERSPAEDVQHCSAVHPCLAGGVLGDVGAPESVRPSATNRRWTRSSWTAGSGRRWRVLRAPPMPQMTACRMSLATRFLATGRPIPRRNSAWTRGAP